MAGTVSVSVKEAKELKSIEGARINFLSREYGVNKFLEQKPGNVFVLEGEEGQPIEVSGDHMLHVPEKLAGKYKDRVEVNALDAATAGLAKLEKKVDDLKGKVSTLENKLKAPKPKPDDKPEVGAGGK